MLLPTIAVLLQLAGATALRSSGSKRTLASVAYQIDALAGRMNSMEEVLKDISMYSFVSLQLPGDISLMSNNTCRLRWNDDKKLEVKLNPHFKSDGNIIAYSLFTDGAAPGGGTLRYHFGLENEDYFLLSLSRTGSTYVRCQTDKMKDASKFYTSVSPFAHLNKKRVAEKLVGMFPEQKNPGRSRKIFSFLAANPPQGYDTGIDWVVGFHYTVGSYESIDSVRELVGKWEDAQK